MTLPTPSIVIFDMDGTTVRHINPALLNVLEKLDDVSYRINRFLGWLFLRQTKGPVFFDEDQVIKRRRPKLLVHRAIHQLRRKPVDQIVEPCPGIYGVLNLLQDQNIPMAVASNGLGKGYGHDILEKFDLEAYFRTSIFREDIKRAKPDPESIMTSIKHMNLTLKPEDVIWYIGDRHKDILAALNAQKHLPCRIVPIAYGLHAAVAVLEKNLSPEHIIMSYFDMAHTLTVLFAERSIKTS